MIMSDDLRAVRVPAYWESPVMSMTRRMSGLLAQLRNEGFTDLSHLGGGYPSPQVSHPLADNAHFEAYQKFRAQQEGISVERLLRRWRSYGPTEGAPEFRERFAEVYGRDFGGTMNPRNLLPTVGSTQGI